MRPTCPAWMLATNPSARHEARVDVSGPDAPTSPSARNEARVDESGLDAGHEPQCSPRGNVDVARVHLGCSELHGPAHSRFQET
jgi:hypothetical protein